MGSDSLLQCRLVLSHKGWYFRWPCRMGRRALYRPIVVSNWHRLFFYIAYVEYMQSSIHHFPKSFCDCNKESHVWQYWLSDPIRYSFGLDVAAHLGLRYSRGKTGSDHLATGLTTLIIPNWSPIYKLNELISNVSSNVGFTSLTLCTGESWSFGQGIFDHRVDFWSRHDTDKG